MAGVYNLRELYSAVMDFNSGEGPSSFSRSGTLVACCLLARSAGKVDARMAGR